MQTFLYILFAIAFFFAMRDAARKQTDVEEYKRKKAEKRARKKKYPSPGEQWDLFIKTGDIERVYRNYMKR